MKLLVVNGSPRKVKSNSGFLTGLMLNDTIRDTFYLYSVKDQDSDSAVSETLQSFSEYDLVFFVFPLYADAAPSGMVRFMERMWDFYSDESGKNLKKPRFLFFIHSGFAEEVHTEQLADYLSFFTDSLGLENAGIIRMGGSEGLRSYPSFMIRKVKNLLESVRDSVVSGGSADPDSLTRIMHDDATIVLIWATNRLKTAKEFHSNDGIQLQTAFQAGYGSFYRSQ